MTNQIEPHESLFCFYLRYNLRHFKEYTNSIYEGTNRALKYNGAPVGSSIKKKMLAIMCCNSARSEKRLRLNQKHNDVIA